jgi:hypothetical protein
VEESDEATTAGAGGHTQQWALVDAGDVGTTDVPA